MAAYYKTTKDCRKNASIQLIYDNNIFGLQPYYNGRKARTNA